MNIKSRGCPHLLKRSWYVLSLDIRKVINDASFKTFLQALWNYDTSKYKDLQLIMALSRQFWDSTYTFHFSGIGEVMLVTYDFLVITGLKLGGERIECHDTISPAEVKDYLGVNPPRVSGNNVSLMWLYLILKSVRVWKLALRCSCFFFFFIGSLLCLNLRSTVSLCYLWSLKDIRCINNYDWGMCERPRQKSMSLKKEIQVPFRAPLFLGKWYGVATYFLYKK